MRCRRCRYRYVLDPKEDPLSDGALREIVAKATGGGRHAVTRDQLAIEICRVLAAKALKIGVGVGVGAIVGLAIVAAFFHGFFPTAIANAVLATLVVGGAFFVWRRRWRARSHRAPIAADLARARQIVDRYHAAHPLDALATGDAYANDGGVMDATPLYTPARIVVVERRDLVDMLVRNQTAQRARAVVVCLDGYPEHVTRACAQFLERDPAIEVALLHDASPEGFMLRDRLRAHPVLGPHADRALDLGWDRTTILAQRGRLPWVGSGRLEFSAGHRAKLDAGDSVPVDFAPPRAMPALLGGALVAGAALVAANGSMLEFEFLLAFDLDDFG